MSVEPVDGEGLLTWDQALAAAFPAAWRQILLERVPFYGALYDDERARFEDRLKVFVFTRTFGSVDLAITEEMKVVVAAAACRLTMNMPWQSYAHVRHVALRAQAFASDDGIPAVGTGGRWKVTVSWPALLEGFAVADDGHNVGYHEFAHALDGADGSMDGEASSPASDLFATWDQVMASGRTEVRLAIEANLEPPIDGYAARNDAEFFAVATEWFFERPRSLREKLPAVYQLLSGFYRQDLAADDRFRESERPIEVGRGQEIPSRQDESAELPEETPRGIRARAEHLASDLGRLPSVDRARAAVRVTVRDLDGWRARNVLRLIGWTCLLLAVFFLFPCTGDGSGRSHVPGSDLHWTVSFTHGVRLAGLIMAGVGLAALVVGLFVSDRDD